MQQVMWLTYLFHKSVAQKISTGYCAPLIICVSVKVGYYHGMGSGTTDICRRYNHLLSVGFTCKVLPINHVLSSNREANKYQLDGQIGCHFLHCNRGYDSKSVSLAVKLFGAFEVMKALYNCRFFLLLQ